MEHEEMLRPVRTTVEQMHTCLSLEVTCGHIP